MLNLSLPETGEGNSRLLALELCLNGPGGQHRNVCRSGGQGWVPQGVTAGCSEFWEVGAFEATHGKYADQLSKCQGCNLYVHSLRIKDGENKND